MNPPTFLKNVYGEVNIENLRSSIMFPEIAMELLKINRKPAL
jgi:hypothetical protein